MIARESIEEVKARVSLVDVAGEVVKLRRQGSSMVGLCPFHSERSPSFHIRDNGKYFHCFGCGAAGNVIAFVMQIRGLSFPDAVTDLAQRYGITLQKTRGEKPERESGDAAQKRTEREKLFKLNAIALEWFLAQAKQSGSPAASYIAERQVLPDVAREFALGYAPDDFHALEKFLTVTRKVPLEWVLRSALVRRNERGEHYDTFRGRLIFPIFDERRRVLGFGGRHLAAPQTKGQPKGQQSDGANYSPAHDSSSSPDGERKIPKYINSPETPVYEKSKVLYGLPHGINDLRTSKEAYIVEGYFDVIGLWQAGIRNVLAPCGTALTDAHVRRLSHLVSRVTLLFDGDAAGINAAGKAFPLFLNSGLDVQVAMIPGGEDPDTFALKAGASARSALAKLPRRPLLDCYVEYLCRSLIAGSGSDAGEIRPQMLPPAAKGKVAAQIGALLVQVRNSVERAELVERAANILKIKAELLVNADTAELKAKEGSDTRVGNESQGASSDEIDSEEDRSVRASPLPPLAAERELLRLSMKLKGDIPSQILQDGELCELLSPTTLEFLTAFDALLTDRRLDLDARKRAARELLLQFGPEWDALWRDAHRERVSAVAAGTQSEVEGGVAIGVALAHLRKLAKKQRLQLVMSGIEAQMQSTLDEGEKLELARVKIQLARQVAGL